MVAMAASLVAACSGLGFSERICEPGEVNCVSQGAEICNDKGTERVISVLSTDKKCVIGGVDGEGKKLPDEVRDVVCEPGALICHENNIYVLKCDETGTSYCYEGNCAAFDGVCVEGLCRSTCNSSEKSNIGCEYFAADLDNAHVPCGSGDCDAAAAQYALVLSNPDFDQVAHVIITTGEIELVETAACASPEVGEDFVAAGRIPPQGLEVFKLPRRDVDGTVKARLAFRVASNIPITVYQFNPLENDNVFSNDASMLFPTTSADKDYLVMTREQVSDSLRGYVTVIGVDIDPTTVTVTPTAPTAAGIGIPALTPGQPYQAVLERFEVLSLQTDKNGADLTGTSVTADQPVVVYGGHEAANAPSTHLCDLTTKTCTFDPAVACGCAPGAGPGCDPHDACRQFVTCCADHLEQQLFPTATWDTEYIAVRSVRRGNEVDVWRILAAEDNTAVQLEPAIATIPILNAGQWFEFESDADFRIQTSQPVMVGQFLVAEHAPGPGPQQGDAGTGDPAFVLATPVRQFRNNYVFLAPDKYAEDFIALAMPQNAVAQLDDVDVEALPLVEVTPISATGWKSLRAPISDGFHTLVCSEPCSVMVHGYDRFVSYGYPGGLNLEPDP